MRIRDWFVLLCVCGLGTILANLIGFNVSVLDSLPGILILISIAFVSVLIDHVINIKLPIIAYCSILGMLLASPISPVRSQVIAYAGMINFTTPLTMVGAFAGMSISNQLRVFAKQGWKMLIISIFVMTGTFLGSAFVAQIILSLTKVI